MYKLDCGVQKYDWGLEGSKSSVARFKSTQDSYFTIDENAKYAELWMGKQKIFEFYKSRLQTNFIQKLYRYASKRTIKVII